MPVYPRRIACLQYIIQIFFFYIFHNSPSPLYIWQLQAGIYICGVIINNYCIESLKKIRKYDVKTGYPGHRDNIDDFTGRIDEIISVIRPFIILTLAASSSLNICANSFCIASFLFSGLNRME